MPSFRSTVPSPNEKFRAEPYKLIQAGPKVGKNPRKREPNDSHHKPTSNSRNDSSHLDNDFCLSSLSSFLLSLNSSSFHLTFPFSLTLTVLPSLPSSLLTSVAILFIGDASQVKVMGSDGNITHASLIADL